MTWAQVRFIAKVLALTVLAHYTFKIGVFLALELWQS
jgi:hypothetical protein